MTKEKKNKSGAGKFFLGAALGALAGAIAGKFISNDADGKTDDCKCGEDCKCGKKSSCEKSANDSTEKTKTTDKPDQKTTKKEA